MFAVFITALCTAAVCLPGGAWLHYKFGARVAHDIEVIRSMKP